MSTLALPLIYGVNVRQPSQIDLIYSVVCAVVIGPIASLLFYFISDINLAVMPLVVGTAVNILAIKVGINYKEAGMKGVVMNTLLALSAYAITGIIF